jgi:hypothetical protein
MVGMVLVSSFTGGATVLVQLIAVWELEETDSHHCGPGWGIKCDSSVQLLFRVGGYLLAATTYQVRWTILNVGLVI